MGEKEVRWVVTFISGCCKTANFGVASAGAGSGTGAYVVGAVGAGAVETRAGSTNTPRFSGHVKYWMPPNLPCMWVVHIDAYTCMRLRMSNHERERERDHS